MPGAGAPAQQPRSRSGNGLGPGARIVGLAGQGEIARSDSRISRIGRSGIVGRVEPVGRPPPGDLHRRHEPKASGRDQCPATRKRNERNLGWSARFAIGAPGFEPGTSCAQGRRATGLRYAPRFSPPQHTMLARLVGEFGPPILAHPARTRRVYGRRGRPPGDRMRSGLRIALAVALGAPVHVVAQSPDTTAIARAAASLDATKSGPRVHERPHQPTSRSTPPLRAPGTWPPARAGSGRPPTPAPPGRRSSTTSPPTRSARSLSIPPTPRWSWVGTGENVSGRHVGWGDGVYRSRDAGRTWQRMGLARSQHIGRILVDPRDGDVVSWPPRARSGSAGGERGVYRTTDGGATWTPVLQIDENTGVTDLEFDPANPDVVYAAAYQRRRHVWGFLGGGPGSGIWKSTDNGKTWRQVKTGLPSGRHGEDRARRHAGRPVPGLRHDRSRRGGARLLPLARPGRELGEAERLHLRRHRPPLLPGDRGLARRTPTWSTRWTSSST